MQVGYYLLDQKGAVVKQWGGDWGQCCAIPNPLILPNGDQVCAARVGETYGEWTLVPFEMEEPTDAMYYKLHRYQFMAMLEVANISQFMHAALRTISDDIERAVIKAKFDVTNVFYRDEKLLALLLDAANMSSDEADKYWMQAREF